MAIKMNWGAPQRGLAAQAGATQTQNRFRQGLALHQQGRHAAAQAVYQEVLRQQATHFDSLHMMGVLAGETGQPEQSLHWLDRALAVRQDVPSVWANRGNALAALQRPTEALSCYDRAIALRPDYANAYANRARARHALRDWVAAAEDFDRALRLQPGQPDWHCDKALALHDAGQYERALQEWDLILSRHAHYARAWCLRGVTLTEMGRYTQALESLGQALAIDPQYAQAHANGGVALAKLQRYAQALSAFDRALELQPDLVQAYNGRADVLYVLGHYAEALENIDQAIVRRPQWALLHALRGGILAAVKRHAEAVLAFDRVLEIDPLYEQVPGTRLHSKMHHADWNHWEQDLAHLEQRVVQGQYATMPFAFLALSDKPDLQRQVAQRWISEQHAQPKSLPRVARHRAHAKTRVGYFSMDFLNHPVALLSAGLYEMHDPERFETYAFSYGPNTQDAMRQRLESAFDHFLDVRARSDAEIAELARSHEIDIAVDLAGLTGHARTGIFARRAAPIQVNYLGYPGTMGAAYIDYLIADEILIPEASRIYYTEKIAYLPSFQVNDRQREISPRAFSREELGLPQNGFVFCCFNSAYKLTPEVFDSWMRILQQVDGSVLWLAQNQAEWMARIQEHAQQRGIAGQRLIAAPSMPSLAEHMARLRAADLFLDTYPFNAMTTASDALWAGLPVLTRAGLSFSSRVAASLLHAIELPELVTHTPAAYEALAVELALQPGKLSAIREKLARQRLQTLLFDTEGFTRHLEDAYTLMMARYHAQQEPEHLFVTRRNRPTAVGV